ncbi:MAG TPA: M56 family metallopeptidase, partial [Gammaproteobacteria bacterium]|nr:M56 family metallopeptidase [Gammaproteobacteria bacterium]
RRCDNLTAAVHMFVEALFWFHPLVWWLGARLVDERERACDEAVLAELGDRESYASAIVAVCELCVRSPLACAAGIGGAGSLRERVERLLTAPAVRGLGALQRCLLAAAAATLVAAPIAFGVLNAPPARAQDNAAAGDRAPQPERTGLDPPGLWIAGPRVTATDLSLRDLIAHAFDVQRRQIVGPDALDSRHYTIVGELPSVDYGLGVDPGEQYRAYWRMLLEQRFDLAFHRETRVVPALSLLSNAWNPSIKPTVEDERVRWFGRGPRPCWPEPCDSAPNHPYSIEARGVPVSALVQYLSQAFDTPVLDRTNLTERYDFTFGWPPEAALAARNGLPSNDALRRALKEQLGLELLAVNAPIELLVIDRIAEPVNAPAVPDDGTDPPAVILRDALPSLTDGAVLELTIDSHASMYVGPNLDTALDARSIVAIAREAVRRDPKLTALVTVDDGLVANHRVVEAANLLGEAGITRMRFSTLHILPNSVLDDSRSVNRAPLPERGVAFTTPRP